MTELELDSLFDQFLAGAPSPASYGSCLPNSQADILVRIVTNNAPVLARQWCLPEPRHDLKARIENDALESEDISVAYAITWMLTACGYFLSEFLLTRSFQPRPVDHERLRQICEFNENRDINMFLKPDLKVMLGKAKSYLVEAYSKESHLSEMFKTGRVEKRCVEELIEKAVLAGSFVSQMAQLVREESN